MMGEMAGFLDDDSTVRQDVHPDKSAGVQHLSVLQNKSNMPPAIAGAVEESKITRHGPADAGYCRPLVHLSKAIPAHLHALMLEQRLHKT